MRKLRKKNRRSGIPFSNAMKVCVESRNEELCAPCAPPEATHADLPVPRLPPDDAARSADLRRKFLAGPAKSSFLRPYRQSMLFHGGQSANLPRRPSRRESPQSYEEIFRKKGFCFPILGRKTVEAGCLCAVRQGKVRGGNRKQIMAEMDKSF